MSSSIVKINENTYNIVLTRGDYLAINVGMTKDGADYKPVGGVLRMAVKKRYRDPDTEVLINKQIPLDTCLLELEKNDTKSLNYGEYDYDIEYTDPQGHPDTFIEGKLTLTKEVL